MKAFAQATVIATLVIHIQSQTSSIVTTSPTNEMEGFDLDILAGVCKDQSQTDQCPKNAHFCAETSECPQQHICTCKLNCGRLLCVIPDMVKVCQWHPIPRFGYTLQKSNIIQFRCDHGHFLVGPRSKTCEEGVWQPIDSHPRCKAVRCESHPSLKNGRIMFNPSNSPRMFNTSAKFFCNPGYTLVNSSHRVCMASRRWSGNQTSCRRDGRWQNWSEWTACDVECGSGRQARVRSCSGREEGGRACVGLAMETRICFAAQACQVPTSTPRQFEVIAKTNSQTFPTPVTVPGDKHAKMSSEVPASESPAASQQSSSNGILRNAGTPAATPPTAPVTASSILAIISSTEQPTQTISSPITPLPSQGQKCKGRARNCRRNWSRACREFTKCMRRRSSISWIRARPVCSGGLTFKNLCRFFEWVCLGGDHTTQCLVKQPMSCCRKMPVDHLGKSTPAVLPSPQTTRSASPEPDNYRTTQGPEVVHFRTKKLSEKATTLLRRPLPQPKRNPKKVKNRRQQLTKKWTRSRQRQTVKRQPRRPTRRPRYQRHRYQSYSRGSMHFQVFLDGSGHHDDDDQQDSRDFTDPDLSVSDLPHISTADDDTAASGDSSGTSAVYPRDTDVDGYGRNDPQ